MGWIWSEWDWPLQMDWIWSECDQSETSLTSTNGLKPSPDFISLAPPHRLPNDHVAVVALVAEHHQHYCRSWLFHTTMGILPNERVVGDAVVHDPAKGRIDRDRTRNRCREECIKKIQVDNNDKDKVWGFDAKKKNDRTQNRCREREKHQKLFQADNDHDFKQDNDE